MPVGNVGWGGRLKGSWIGRRRKNPLSLFVAGGGRTRNPNCASLSLSLFKASEPNPKLIPNSRECDYSKKKLQVFSISIWLLCRTRRRLYREKKLMMWQIWVARFLEELSYLKWSGTQCIVTWYSDINSLRVFCNKVRVTTLLFFFTVAS